MTDKRNNMTEEDWSHVRAALLTASITCDAVMLQHPRNSSNYNTLDGARKNYLSLAEQLAP